MVTIKVEAGTKKRIKEVAQELGLTIDRLLRLVFELNVYKMVLERLLSSVEGK